MLIQLSIRDIVLIEKLDIHFDVGLSVLTGETGAGKSILLDSLSLALGARGDASLVRHGMQQGQVTAVFDVAIDHPARLLMRENGLEDDGDIILRRIQSSDGRSRVFINDQVASVSLIRELGRHLVEIHGQHADRALIDINAHRDLLDAFGMLNGDVSVLKQHYQTWRTLEKGLTQYRAKVEADAKEADYLRACVEELSLLNPQLGEEVFLADRRATMMKSEKIACDINEASDTLSGSASPIPILANLVRRLERKMTEAQDIVEPIIKQIDQALDSLGLAQDHVEQAMRIIDFDPHELETVEERLFALRAAARKHAVAVENLPELRDKFDLNLANIEASETTLSQMEAEVLAACSAYDKLAQELSQKRQAAALQLQATVMAELPALKLERAKFIIEFTSDKNERQAEGIDRIEFYVQTNPGTKAGPMMKVASGGELSRFLLALKVALADRGSAPTLVFDEIDTGVGGAVADAIGQRLKRLAQNVQVLSVTHAPQVAARANQHFLISKASSSDSNNDSERVSSKIHLMNSKERMEEIARMLAGAEITSEARAAAKKLLNHKD